MSGVFGRLQGRQQALPSALLDARVAKSDESLLRRLALSHTLDFHRGCVNTIKWDWSGTRILSGSDDHRLVLADAFDRETKRPEVVVETGHKGNIFSADFLDERNVVSAAGDGRIVYTNLERPAESSDCVFTCHTWATYEVIGVANEPNCFMSAGEDGAVRLFDLRIKDKCLKHNCTEDVIIGSRYPVTALALNPLRPHHLAVGTSDSSVRLYDRRVLSTSSLCSRALLSRFRIGGQKQRKVTSVAFRPDGMELLASFSSDFIYIFDPLADDLSLERNLYVGKRSSRTTTSSSSTRPKRFRRSPPPMRRLRLRGDWSDTGPNARPDNRDGSNDNQVVQDTSSSHPGRSGNLMQRMTDALSRMLNDPSTRRALLNSQEERRTEQQAGVESHQQNSNSDENDPEDHNNGNSRTGSSIIERTEESTGINDDQNSDNGGNELRTIETDSTRPSSANSSSSTTVPESQSPNEGNASSPSSPTLPASNPREIGSPSPNEPLSVDTLRLPGPSQVITHPGNPGVDPLTGRRQRRRGVSGPPSALTPYDCTALGRDSDEGEFEVDDDNLDGDSARRVLRPPVIQRFVGHRNARTMIKEASWWGNDYVLSGSDCGHVIGWSRKSGRVVLLLEADRHVVNSVRPHPQHPILATSGIDYNVKLWMPTKLEGDLNQEAIDDLVRRNEVMLRETMDTVTVPPTLMIRMLASLNQLRRTNSQRARVNDDENDQVPDTEIRNPDGESTPNHNNREDSQDGHGHDRNRDSDDDGL